MSRRMSSSGTGWRSRAGSLAARLLTKRRKKRSTSVTGSLECGPSVRQLREGHPAVSSKVAGGSLHQHQRKLLFLRYPLFESGEPRIGIVSGIQALGLPRREPVVEFGAHRAVGGALLLRGADGQPV